MVSFFSKLTGAKSQEEHILKGGANKSINGSEEAGDWLDENYEGQLSVDVYSTDKEIVIKSTIAGVQVEDIDISINNDMLTIRGERKEETDERLEDYYYQECYWGSFSRSIILPVEVDSDKVAASLKNGVLTVRLPKVRKTKNVLVKVKEES